MSYWGYGIFENDLNCDIRGFYNEYINKGYDIDTSTELTLRHYEIIDPQIPEQERKNRNMHVYIALGELQMTEGYLLTRLKGKILELINDKDNTWKEQCRMFNPQVISSFKEKLQKY